MDKKEIENQLKDIFSAKENYENQGKKDDVFFTEFTEMDNILLGNSKETDDDFLKELKEIDAINSDIIIYSADSLEQKMAEKAERLQRIRKQELKRKKIREKEINRFKKSILLSMESLTEEEKLRVANMLLYGNKGAISKMITIYTKNIKNEELEISDITTIVKESLIRIIEECTLNIEKAHKEFPLIDPLKKPLFKSRI